MGLSEGCLENDIEDALDDRVLVVDELLCELSGGLSRLLDDDLTGLVLECRLDLHSLRDWLHGENHTARGNVGAKHLEQVPILLTEALVDQRSFEYFIGPHSQSVLVDIDFLPQVKFKVVGAKRDRAATSSSRGLAPATSSATTTAATTATAASTIASGILASLRL